MGVGGQRHAPAAFPPRKTRYPLYRRLGGPQGSSGLEVQLYSFFNLSAIWVWVANATSRPLYPRERPGTHFIGGWMGPRVGLEGCGKSQPTPGSDPLTVQPVASFICIFTHLFYRVTCLCRWSRQIKQNNCRFS